MHNAQQALVRRRGYLKNKIWRLQGKNKAYKKSLTMCNAEERKIFESYKPSHRRKGPRLTPKERHAERWANEPDYVRAVLVDRAFRHNDLFKLYKITQFTNPRYYIACSKKPIEEFRQN